MEYWDLYNSNREFLDKTILRGTTLPKDTYHLVVHFWLVNTKNEFLIQKRSQKVETNKGIWSNTGGSVLKGETIENGLCREVEEELGIKISFQDTKNILSYKNSDSLIEVFMLKNDIKLKDFSPNNEVDEYAYVSLSEINYMVSKALFVDFGVSYFDVLYQNIK